MLVRVLTKTLRLLDSQLVYFETVLFARCSKMDAATTTEAEGYIKTLVGVLSQRLAFATKNRYNYGLNKSNKATTHPLSHLSGRVVSDAECYAVRPQFESRRRHGCL
ncbi:hypothetical protein TNCV_4089571 [Trichonephila clavipes]|nr:hypothetical protein TNCV_4089571 [Trichonephila clavipes]